MAIPNVAVLVPWRDGCPHRERALAWTLRRYEALHPDWPIVLGESPDGPFGRSAAILDAASKVDADIYVVTDGDVWVDPTESVARAAEVGWAVPHRLIHRLSADSTALVLEGADWHGLPLSTDNPQDSRPYKGNETGTIFTITSDLLAEVPPDPRFRGWGQEDEAHGLALRCLVGPPWRGDDDLVHLWHPPQPRQTRRIGNPRSKALHGRYVAARRSPERMRALLAEAQAVAA